MNEATPDPALRHCHRCDQWKPLTDFVKHRWCRDCRRTHKAQWDAGHQEHRRQYETANREQYHANYRRWAASHRDANLARLKAWRQANKTHRREYERQWRAANHEMKLATEKAWRRANPEQWTEYQRRRKARKRSATIGFITPELLAAKLAYWGWCCWLCGGVPAAWDHVKPLSKGGRHCLANLRPACTSCNSTKRERWPFPTHRRH